MDDREIIKLFFERSEQAITELSNKYGTVCSKIAFNILNSKQDAEECVNDAYLGVWNTVPPQDPSPLLSYVCRIVRNLSIKKYRANTADKRNSIYDVALDELENGINADNLETSKLYQEYVDAAENQIKNPHPSLSDNFLAKNDVDYGDGSHNAQIQKEILKEEKKIIYKKIRKFY